MKVDNATVKNRVRTQAMVALAVLALFAGASVGASLEEFAAPTYAEDDWAAGVVDDATDDEGWDERDSDDGPMKNGAKEFIRSIMSDRMDDRMDDRVEHLEQRIAAGQEFIIALKFCQEQTECTAEFDDLQDMIDNMETKHIDMQEKIDAHSQEELQEEEQMMMVDDDGQDDETASSDNGNDELFDCRTREMWSDEKQEWCDKFMDKENWHHWDDDRKMDYAKDRAEMLEAASIAIAYCLKDDECTADPSAITSIHDIMMEKHDRHIMCAEDKKCDRGKHDRRGLLERFSDAIRGELGEKENRDDFDREIHVMADIEVTQEMCELRGGDWIVADDRSACVWPEFDRDCDKDRDREDRPEDDREEETSDSDDTEEDREDQSNDSATSQEECEASGGTWSEERQLCY
tara:strand:+ start:18204 stop:19418 length:1215 start_codon:yes stop_codon:yes gene_type:complete